MTPAEWWAVAFVVALVYAISCRWDKGAAERDAERYKRNWDLVSRELREANAAKWELAVAKTTIETIRKLIEDATPEED